jgi:RNA polymerase sigma factor for flagellar operon FliA
VNNAIAGRPGHAEYRRMGSHAVNPPPRCARSEQLIAHRPLVRRIALKMRARLPAGVDTDELMQAGMIGLNEALTRFEEGRGATFGTYASRRIEGAMLDALRAADTLPRGVRARLREVHNAVQILEQRLGRTPRAKEVATELGWTLDEFHHCMREAGAGAVRATDEALDHPDAEASGMGAFDETHSSHAALTGWDEQADPMRYLQQRQRHHALGAAFDALEDRERLLMEMIYERDLTLHDVGTVLGVSAPRVCQLHDAILTKLKRRLRDW